MTKHTQFTAFPLLSPSPPSKAVPSSPPFASQSPVSAQMGCFSSRSVAALPAKRGPRHCKAPAHLRSQLPGPKTSSPVTQRLRKPSTRLSCTGIPLDCAYERDGVTTIPSSKSHIRVGCRRSSKTRTLWAFMSRQLMLDHSVPFRSLLLAPGRSTAELLAQQHLSQ